MKKQTFFGHTIYCDSLGNYLLLHENDCFTLYFLQALSRNHYYVFDVIQDQNDEYFKVYFKNIDNLLNR